ncbi:MAG: putative porin [Bacteroidota bacterium]
MIRHISIILFFVFSSGLFAQKPDSLKKPRILKEWNLSVDFSEEVNIPFDTVFSLFNRVKIADKYSPVNAYLGNYGLPFYQISFFDRITDPDKFLYNYYYPLMHLTDKALFMNTQVPFTELDWSFAGPRETSEQTFRVRHSQNVNRFLNFGLMYDIVYSLGQYNYQRAEDKTFTIYSSYTGVKYKLYFAAGINNLTSYENGGITDKKELSNFVSSKIRDVPVNLGGLNNAVSLLKNRNLLLVQRFTIERNPGTKTDSLQNRKPGFFGLSGTFSHIFTLDANRRTYSDANPASGFYDSIYISKTTTFDSLYSRVIKNTVRFDFTTDETKKIRLGGGVGFRNEIFRYSQIIPNHRVTIADTTIWNKSSNVVVGKLLNSIGDKFRWITTGELYLTGYRAGDFNINGEITKSFDWKKGRASWLITGSMMNRQPSFWYENWGSNHFIWHKKFNKEFRIDLGTAFSYPARKTEIKFNYAIIKNYTDFDTLAFPSQYSGGLSVAAFTMRKGLRAWKFHLDTDVIIQKSSNPEVLDLPLAAIRSSGYFEHLFRFKSTGGRLNTQLGVDVTYNTLYHPYSYMPATGRFYRQDQSVAGNYPFINVFVNLKIQRTRLFFMFDHLNSGKMGYNYDMVPLYPMNIRMFRYGLAWTFYN